MTEESEKTEEVISTQIEEKPKKVDEKYRYFWLGDDIPYNSHEDLKEVHPEACDIDKHEWRSTFVFALYFCLKCKARREVKP